jgi:hypothetical protein
MFRDRSPTASIKSLRALQLDTRALVIVLEAEIMLIGGHQVVLKGVSKTPIQVIW